MRFMFDAEKMLTTFANKAMLLPAAPTRQARDLARRTFSVAIVSDRGSTQTAARSSTSSASSSLSSSFHQLPPLDTAPLVNFLSFPSLTLAPALPAQSPLQVGQRLVVIGDVHGDYQALQQMLRLAGVVGDNDNDHDEWKGGDTIVVQCGDMMDRGGQELACWALLCRLSHQAAAAGGAVSVLWGNHEVLNATGLFHYTTGPHEFERLLGKPLDLHTPMRHAWRRQFAGNQPVRWAACEPGGLLAQSLLSQLSVALVVGRTLCVHAGLTVRHLGDVQDGGNLATLNHEAREWITTVHHQHNFNTLSHKVPPDHVMALANARAQAAAKALPACLGGRGTEARSPVWLRDYSSPPGALDAAVTDELHATLDRVAAQRIVMGHTPQSQINATAAGKAWRVDIAASQGMGGGTPEVLEIVHGETEDELYILTRQGRIPANERIVG